jgi:uncharacterized protein (DUF2252 family)
MAATDAATKAADERAAAGKAARADVPRSNHAEWDPPPDRRNPVDVLTEQDATRVPELVPIRHGRMLVSAFTFYRGAAGIMVADLARTPTTDLKVQLCGDAHLSNFGVFAAPDRDLVFDLNDFDETAPGPFEWDIKRLAASLEIAGRDRGFATPERRDVVTAGVGEYRTTMRAFAEMRDLDVWYARLDVDKALARLGPVLTKRRRKEVEQTVSKARQEGQHARAIEADHV